MTRLVLAIGELNGFFLRDDICVCVQIYIYMWWLPETYVMAHVQVPCKLQPILDSWAVLIEGGRRILSRDHIMGPTRVPLLDPCPVG